MLGIQGLEGFGNEPAILADEFSVEVDGPAAVIFALDVDEIPVDLGAVAVFGLFVALAWGEVERAVDFLIEENIAHRVKNVGIEGDGKFADETGAGVAIEDGVEFVGVIGGGVDDFAIFEFEADLVEGDALIDAGGVVGDVALDGVADGGGEDLAIGDIVAAAAGLGGDAFDGELEIGAWAFNFDEIGIVHHGLEGGHAWFHFGVIEGANGEVKVFESLGAHAGTLGHGRGGPAEDAPAGFFDSPVEDGLHAFSDELHLGRWDIAHFGDVIASAEGDVGVHFFDEGELSGGVDGEVFLLGAPMHFAGDSGLVSLDKGDGASVAGGADESHGHLGRDIEGVDEDLFSWLEFGGEVDDAVGELIEARILHKETRRVAEIAGLPRQEDALGGRSRTAVRGRGFFPRGGWASGWRSDRRGIGHRRKRGWGER